MTTPPTKKPFLPPRWFIHFFWRLHRGLYKVSGGRLGLRRPKPTSYGLMAVTTKGRRTGRDRRVMLAYFEEGPDLVTLAMNGWGAAEPSWWLNLQAEPEVEVDLVGGSRAVVARTASGEEREHLWARWREFDKQLDAFAGLRPRETVVVVLEPRSTSS